MRIIRSLVTALSLLVIFAACALSRPVRQAQGRPDPFDRLRVVPSKVEGRAQPRETFARADQAPVITNGDLEQLNADGFPLDWQPVGESVTITSDAHSGKVAFRLVRTAETPTPETGLNRGWKPDSGERGAMLDRLKGAVVFHYKAVSQSRPGSLQVQMIPMSARPYEDTASARVIFAAPDAHVSDGQWHRGVVRYDFTDDPKVRWVHIGPRLTGPGELLLDDFSWTDRVGPLLQVGRVGWSESNEAPGREATITLKLENRGDAPSPATTLAAQMPAGLELSPAPPATVPALASGEACELTLTLRGERRAKGLLRFQIAAVPEPVTVSLPLTVEATLDKVVVDEFIVAPGEETKLRVTVANTGRVFLPQVNVTAAGEGIASREPARRQVTQFAPGARATLEWTLSPTVENPMAQVEVTADVPGGPLAQTVRLVCLTPGEEAAIGDDVRSLVVRETGLGYGLCELKVRKDGGFVVVAKMPYLARLVFETASGARDEKLLYGRLTRTTPTELAFDSTFTDAENAKWRCTATFRRTPAGRFALDYALAVDRPRALLAFEGPMLYVAEGTGAPRYDGLFPGLEWLVEGEESSSALDIERDHPDRLRCVPNPNKITIPLMSLRTADGVVALLWDPRQQWDGERDRPAAVFASPDRFERRASHLMGLMLPSVPDFVPEGARQAEHAYELAPGRELRLTALLMADPDATDALVAQDAWIEEFGIPDPMPYPHGTPLREIAFSARAYLDSLWAPDEEQWLPYKGGPGIWAAPSRNPSFAYDLAVASVLAADAAVRAACAARLERLAAAGPLVPSSGDFGFDYGRAEQGLAGALSQATMTMDRQGDDGAWRFDADLQDQGVFKGLDYHELGEDDAAQLGTCARNAYVILLAARMTGAREAYDAGVRALRFMEQFTVPRAAQVWEVPVHTPDLLAAADAVDAYLEAYRIDGDPHWLEQAVGWARRGLPFIYLWDEPEFPFMRYASIPVFGASWHKWSWFGRAVQWNGLRYAYALLKLSEYDSTLPWRGIAEGVTVSAMYQQATDPPDVALWPDSISLIDAGKSGWIFAPQLILKNVYYLLGRPDEPETVSMRVGDSSLHVTSGAAISSVALAGDELRLSLTYPRRKSGTTAVVGISAPAAVSVDGSPVPNVADLMAAQGPAYRYVPAMAALLVRILDDGAHDVVIRGVAPRQVDLFPAVVSQVNFDFDASAEGWIPANELLPFDVVDGALVTSATGGDPYMTRSRTQVDGDAVRELSVRLAVTAGRGAQFYWATADDPTFSEARVANFPIEPDGQFHTYRIEVGDHQQWRGHKIVAIRFDPTVAAPGASIKIDWMRGE